MPTANNLSSVQISADLLDLAARHAERDADLVAGLLQRLGIARRHPTDPPIRLPARALIGLGIAMRLFHLESRGLRIHLAAGLPSAKEALVEICRWFTAAANQQADARYMCWWITLNELSIRRFAWSGPSILGADIILGDADEESLIEAIAQLAWAHRHEGAQDEIR